MSPELKELSSMLKIKGREKDGKGLQPVLDKLKEGILELVLELKELRKDYEG